MNKKNVNIHFCTKKEIDGVMKFIGEYWQKGHILSRSRLLMDWQYYNKEEQRYNFVLASNIINGEILGLLGYISLKRYDPALESDNTIWLALWFVREDANIAGLGIMIHHFLISKEKHHLIGVIGFNSKVELIYKLFGYDVGILNQYYILNKKSRKFNLAMIPDVSALVFNKHAETRKEFRKVTIENFEEVSRMILYVQPDIIVPRKSLEYFRRRFLYHPIYSYHLYAILEEEVLQGLLALRCAEVKEGCALRIVDYFGPDYGLVGTATYLQYLMEEFNAEYVDMYNIGIDASILAESGFSKLDPKGDIIIPNYFEPFEKKNVDIRYAYKTNRKVKYMIFKGDGDQDRPNKI